LFTELENLALSENGFLFNALTGNTYTLNSTGKTILQGIIKNKNYDDIVNDLTEKFDVPVQTANKDVLDFIQHLKVVDVIPKNIY
jgi:hypothetical protein